MTPETAALLRGGMDAFVRESAEKAGFQYPMAVTAMAASGHIVALRYEGDAKVTPVGEYTPGCKWRFPATMTVIDARLVAGGPYTFFHEGVEALKRQLF